MTQTPPPGTLVGLGSHQITVTVKDEAGNEGLPCVFTFEVVDETPPPTEVVAWGDNTSGQCNVPEGLADAVLVAAGLQHSVALLGDGTVVAWGGDTYGQATVPRDLTGVVGITAGWEHNVVLKGDGTVVAWGTTTMANAPCLTD